MKVTLGEIADRFDLDLKGDSSLEITGLASLQQARQGQLAFLFSPAYRKYLSETGATAVVLTESDRNFYSGACLVSDQPRLAWARIASVFDTAPLPERRIHEGAVVSDGAMLGDQVDVGPGAVIEDGVVLSDEVSIGAGCYIGHGVRIGRNTRLFPKVTIYHDVQIGSDCRIHSHAVVGADGFGYEIDREDGSVVKVPQIYGVVIGDCVEIGAGTTIDRGALEHTLIGDGVKLDSQVQVGHGTSIGNNTLISGCTGIAGSTRIGANCLIGGAVGIVDNIEIADGVEITAMSLVSRSITTGGRYSSGTGLMPARQWKRSIVGFSRLDELLKRIQKLEKTQNKNTTN